jgi:malonyl-CoA O-methyltransferase
MSEVRSLRQRRVRRNFARAAANYESFAVLSREVLARMLERVAIMQLIPRRILDLGSGTGMAAHAMAERYRAADVIALDLSLPMLQQQSQRSPWRRTLRLMRGGGRRSSVCADFEQLPLRTDSIDMVVSNLALHWSGDIARAFAETGRVLRTGGLFVFSTFGPDTLKELAHATADTSGRTPVHSFIDMHDLGDALVASGFSDPVMEMEQLTLTYQSLDALLRDLKGTGGSSTRGATGLRTARWRARIAERYEALRREGRLPATFEIVYGHAWKAERRMPARADGLAVIEFQPRRRKV